MERNQLIQFILSTNIFAEFKPEDLEPLLPYFEVAEYFPGEYVIREGEKGENMYTFIRGKADIAKTDPETNERHIIGTVEPGNWYGEMASIERSVRSASICCTEKSEILILHLEKLENTENIFYKLQSIIAKNMSRRLRTADEKIVASLTENLKILQASSVLGRTIVHIFVLIAVWFNLALVLRYIPHKHPAIDPLFTAGLLALFGYFMARIIKESGYPISFFGLTMKNWGKVTLQAIIYTTPILLLLACLKWVLITHFSQFEHLPFIAFKPPDQTVVEALIFGFMYIITVPVQEFIIRGGIQTCFRNFFLGPNRVYLAILTSNLLFELLHTVKNLPLAVGTFILGFFWGALFEQQKSLIGVTVSHILIGAWAFFVLEFQTVMYLAKL